MAGEKLRLEEQRRDLQQKAAKVQLQHLQQSIIEGAEGGGKVPSGAAPMQEELESLRRLRLALLEQKTAMEEERGKLELEQSEVRRGVEWSRAEWGEAWARVRQARAGAEWGEAWGGAG